MSDVEFSLGIKVRVTEGALTTLCPDCDGEIKVPHENVKSVVLNVSTKKIECLLNEPLECPYEESNSLKYTLLPYKIPFNYLSSNSYPPKQEEEKKKEEEEEEKKKEKEKTKTDIFQYIHSRKDTKRYPPQPELTYPSQPEYPSQPMNPRDKEF